MVMRELKVRTLLAFVLVFALEAVLVVAHVRADAGPDPTGDKPAPVETDDGSSRSSPTDRAVLIPIHGSIDPFIAVLLQRGVDEAERREVSHIIIDIDTFGGRVDTALQVANTLSRVTDIETVAYVGTGDSGTGVSWSAGALIALACNRIFMAPGTSIGAAAPVVQGVEGQEAAGEKVVSAVRGQMAALAEKNGHPPAVARAMVDASVVLIAATVDGREQLFTEEEVEVLRRRAEEGEIDFIEGAVVSPVDKLLTLTAGEMERYGVSEGTLVTVEDLEAELGVPVGSTLVLEMNPADRLVAVLTGSGFAGLLIAAGLVALFVEITSPGFGLPGAIALVCFGTFFASNLLLGHVGSLEIIFFVCGLALLIFEVFVIPGFGIAGIAGIAVLVLSFVLTMQDYVIPQYDWQWRLTARNLAFVVGSTLGAVLLAGLFAMLVKDTRLFRRLMLATTHTSEEGFTAQTVSERDRYLGKRGTVRTDLRPAGNITVDNEVVQAESEGSYIDRGTEVRVVRVDGNRIVVRSV